MVPYVEGRAAGVVRAAHKGGRNKGREPRRISLCPSLAVTTTTTNSRTARLKIDFDILPRVLRSSSSRFFPPAIFLLSRFKREIMVNEEGGRGNGTRSRGG